MESQPMKHASDEYLDALTAIPFQARYILRINFPDPLGTEHYSDSVKPHPLIYPRIIINSIAVSRADGLTVAELTLSDPLGIIHTRFVSGQLESRPAVLYHTPDELSADDWFPLATGYIGQAIDFDNESKTVWLRIVSGAMAVRSHIGTTAMRDAFPDILAADQGLMLPVAYGRVNRVRAVGVGLGARTALSRPLRANGTELWVSDPSGFPAGAIQLKIGRASCRERV